MIIPTLETERLRLRPWRDSDIDGFAELMADDSSRFVGGPLSREDAWRKMATYVGHWSLRGYGSWALEDKRTGAYIGYCGPWYPLGWPEPEIGWGLKTAARGQGYAAEAAQAAVSHVYQTLKWPTAISLIASENASSIKVAERLGARFETAMHNRGFPVGIYRHREPSHFLAPHA